MNFYIFVCLTRPVVAILGTGVIIISPTRELSMQTFGVLKELLKYHSHTYGLIMGGTSKADEAKKLAKVGVIFLQYGLLWRNLTLGRDFLFYTA